jgi:hypothetical protein
MAETKHLGGNGTSVDPFHFTVHSDEVDEIRPIANKDLLRNVNKAYIVYEWQRGHKASMELFSKESYLLREDAKWGITRYLFKGVQRSPDHGLRFKRVPFEWQTPSMCKSSRKCDIYRERSRHQVYQSNRRDYQRIMAAEKDFRARVARGDNVSGAGDLYSGIRSSRDPYRRQTSSVGKLREDATTPEGTIPTAQPVKVGDVIQERNRFPQSHRFPSLVAKRSLAYTNPASQRARASARTKRANQLPQAHPD